ncbi:MAG: DEAD/DEAH box helicase [gamma proteobacterium symbiont of Taylorina sp.]|nr:DEAD/DEAH box helicase [gamma proteobacterium symbiont of Taylorina sp.]
MDNDAFQELNPVVQKWVYKQGWNDLRDIQNDAIKPILSGKTDVIISAATAAGKTEAAFLPACSAIAEDTESFGILYISPLKALINDQYRRLESLCDMLDMKVTAWHGDSSQSKKKHARRNPQGILLITPESLESLLIRDAGWVRMAFESLKYIIIDEYHAFIGFERGNHLQSLMHRLENLLDRQKTPIPRIALSATLGDMDNVLRYLRPDNSIPCSLIKGSQTKTSLKMQIRGYINQDSQEDNEQEEFVNTPLSAEKQVVQDLYELLRGDSHLVFANSRQRTEHIAVMLSELCQQNLVPNEFFPHHGSLSKELRTELESRLQKDTLPTTAVCTMTLELGIDIGKVKSVCQVTAPHSVASLRQRLGRSGRRGDPAILRMFITENELNANSNIVDKLRIELLQSIAMIRLLLSEKWYEPADTELFHFSTLLHQILAIIAQWGGVRADQLWELLCKSGPFNKVTIEHFKILLSDMGEKRLISQLSSGELVLADKGEKLVDHYTFYAVFKTPEEFRIVFDGKTLGTLPVDSMVIPEQHIVFGGRRWKIKEIDVDKKVVYVISAKAGKPPKFGGHGMSVHDRVRQEMLRIYLEGDYRISVGNTKLEFMDATAKNLFYEGLSFFRELKLEKKHIISHSKHVYIIPWMGDKVVNTLTILLIKSGYKASCYAGVIEIDNANYSEISEFIQSISEKDIPSNAELAEFIENKQIEKYDYLLPDNLLNEGYGAKAFDIVGTIDWLTKVKIR